MTLLQPQCPRRQSRALVSTLSLHIIFIQRVSADFYAVKLQMQMTSKLFDLTNNYKRSRKEEIAERTKQLTAAVVLPHVARVKIGGAKSNAEAAHSKATNVRTKPITKPKRGSKKQGEKGRRKTHSRLYSQYSDEENEDDEIDEEELEQAKNKKKPTKTAKTAKAKCKRKKTDKKLTSVIGKRCQTSQEGDTMLQYHVTWEGKKESGKPTWIDADEMPLTADKLVDDYEATLAEDARLALEAKTVETVQTIYNRLCAENTKSSMWVKNRLWAMAEEEFAQLPLPPRRR